MNKLKFAEGPLSKIKLPKETLNKTKYLIANNKKIIILGAILTIFIAIYLIYFYNRVDRYLSKMKPFKK